MNVPEVVKTAIRMKTHMAMLGPASQSQQRDAEEEVALERATAAWSTPNCARITWNSPRGS